MKIKYPTRYERVKARSIALENLKLFGVTTSIVIVFCTILWTILNYPAQVFGGTFVLLWVILLCKFVRWAWIAFGPLTDD